MLIDELKLLARGVIVLDPSGKVVYTETVKEVTSEPNYEGAIKFLKETAPVTPPPSSSISFHPETPRHTYTEPSVSASVS